MKYIFGIAVSVILVAIGGTLLYYAALSADMEERYRAAIVLAQDIGQLDANWSVETARVEADPLADFDSLAAYIPEADRLTDELAQTVRMIPEIPVGISNDIKSYLSSVKAKEERVERFKTSYAVIRNSVRYLPLAAGSLTRIADDSNNQVIANQIPRLTQDINTYMINPSEVDQRRLLRELESLRNASVTFPPTLANALANFVAHAEVLLTRKTTTDEIFREATSDDIAERTENLTDDLRIEVGRSAQQVQNFRMGSLGTLAALIITWVLLAVFRLTDQSRKARTISEEEARRLAVELSAISDASRPAERPAEGLAPEPSPAPALAPVQAAPEPSPPPETMSTSAVPTTRLARMVNRLVAGFVGNRLTSTTQQILTRLDNLQQAQERIRAAAAPGSGGTVARNLHLNEEIETFHALLSSIRRQVDDLQNLATKFTAFSAQFGQDADHELVNVERCLQEARQMVDADQAATVEVNCGTLPDIFASKFDMLLLFGHLLENAVLSVQACTVRPGIIKIEAEHRNDVIVVTIVDNGDGFQVDEKSRVFEPFFTTRDTAFGIGLPTAVSLADRYRGVVSANSLPGQGSMFRVTLSAGFTGEAQG